MYDSESRAGYAPQHRFGGVEELLEKTQLNKICFKGFFLIGFALEYFLCYLEICNLVQSVSGVGSQRDDNQESSKDAKTEDVLIF